jgi:hypothetical protein
MSGVGMTAVDVVAGAEVRSKLSSKAIGMTPIEGRIVDVGVGLEEDGPASDGTLFPAGMQWTSTPSPPAARARSVTTRRMAKWFSTGGPKTHARPLGFG